MTAGVALPCSRGSSASAQIHSPSLSDAEIAKDNVQDFLKVDLASNAPELLHSLAQLFRHGDNVILPGELGKEESKVGQKERPQKKRDELAGDSTQCDVPFTDRLTSARSRLSTQVPRWARCRAREMAGPSEAERSHRRRTTAVSCASKASSPSPVVQESATVVCASPAPGAGAASSQAALVPLAAARVDADARSLLLSTGRTLWPAASEA